MREKRNRGDWSNLRLYNPPVMYCHKEIIRRATVWLKLAEATQPHTLLSQTSTLQICYFTGIPHLTYCDIVWHFFKTADRRKLERIQERALRAIFKSKVDTYSTLLNRASLSTLYERRLQSIATLMFKVKNGLMPLYITEIFQSTYKGYELRNADFNVPGFRMSRGSERPVTANTHFVTSDRTYGGS